MQIWIILCCAWVIAFTTVFCCDVLFLHGKHSGLLSYCCKYIKLIFWICSRFWCFYFCNQNLLPIQKIHFTHLQQYEENHCVSLARIGRYSEKAGRNLFLHNPHKSLVAHLTMLLSNRVLCVCRVITVVVTARTPTVLDDTSDVITIAAPIHHLQCH